VTAPDPRLDEIQARLSAADATDIEWSSLPALTDDDVIMFRVYDDEGHAIAECSDMAVASLAGHAPADLAFLLAELRKAREALARVEAVADDLATQSDGLGLDYSDDDFDRGWHGANRAAVDQLRAAVAAAKGDE
jgi:hypothetical protein